MTVHKSLASSLTQITVAATTNDGEPPQMDYILPYDIDSLLSDELLRLSLRDRNAIDEEIHGVLALAPKESPQFLEAALFELSVELNRIPNGIPYKAAYLESQRFPKTYVNGSDFRLRFLRCELFYVKKAAIRMVKFLSIASDLFGPFVLQRPVRITDLTKEEEKIFRMGNIQPLPYRDRAGRTILTWVGDFGLEQGESRIRAKLYLYLVYAMTDDVESQRKGSLLIIWVGSNNFLGAVPTWDNVEIFKRLDEGYPLRACCHHFCLPDKPYFHALRSMYALTHGTSSRPRLKFHVGEEIEQLYKLKSYGIPVELIPVTGTGNIKTIYLKQWIRLRKTLEDIRAKELDDSSLYQLPRSTDVIFRTGTSLTCHPGNSMFQSIIESKMKEHSEASQAGKMIITREIIDTVRQNEGRFLQWDTRGWWTELTGASQVHTKVAVSVRDFKSKSVAQQNRQDCQSSTSVFENQDGKRRKCTRDNGWVKGCRLLVIDKKGGNTM